jgi:hypothetical protein
MSKSFLKIEIKAPVSNADVIGQAKMLATLEEPLEALRGLLPPGTVVETRLMAERGPLKNPRKRRSANGAAQPSDQPQMPV